MNGSSVRPSTSQTTGRMNKCLPGLVWGSEKCTDGQLTHARMRPCVRQMSLWSGLGVRNMHMQTNMHHCAHARAKNGLAAPRLKKKKKKRKDHFFSFRLKKSKLFRPTD